MFLKQLFEDKIKTAVLGWGRGMGHKGHMLLAKAVLHHAQENSAKPYFVVSRTSLVDPSTGEPWKDRPTFTKNKDDPLTPEEKLNTYRKVFPQNAEVFSVATPDASTLDKVLSKIAKAGFRKVILVVGEQEKDSFGFLTRPDKSGVPPYQRAGLQELEIISRQDTTEPSSVKGSPKYQEGPRATPMRQVLLDPTKSEEEQFAIWRRDMPDDLSDEEVMDLMLKAKSRMMAVPAAKNKKKSVAEGIESATSNLDAVFNEYDFYRLEHIWPALEAGDKKEALRQINHYLNRGKNRAWWGDLQAIDIKIDPTDVENSQVMWSKPIQQQGAVEGQLNELDMFAPVTTYVRLANGEYVAASWRRNQDLSTAGNSASFINIKPLDPNAAKKLGLDKILNDPEKNHSSTTIASGGPIQGSGPFADRTINVVDMNDIKSAKNIGIPDEIFGKIAQWVQQQDQKQQGAAKGQLDELSKDTIKSYVPARIDAATKLVKTDKKKAARIATKDLPRALNKLKDPNYGKQNDQDIVEEEKKGLYYYVNKRKKAGTSRSKNHPKAPSEQDWKDAAKTAKRENVTKEQYGPAATAAIQQGKSPSMVAYADSQDKLNIGKELKVRQQIEKGEDPTLSAAGNAARKAGNVTVEGHLEIGQQMANDGITYSPEKEKEIINLMAQYMQKAGMSSKQIRYLLSYDEDYIPDQLSFLSKQDVEENKIKGVDGKACWKGKRYAGKEKKADGTYKDKCVPLSEDIENKMSSLIKILSSKA